MDNSKYYQSNLAHDFALFEKKDKRNAKIIKVPTKKTKTRVKKRLKISTFNRIFYILTGLTIAFGLIFSVLIQSEIHKVSLKMNTAEREAVRLKSEAKTLEVEYIRITEAQSIRKKALDVGMRPVEKNQITYIFDLENNS